MDYKYTYGSFLDFMSKMNSFTSSGPAASNHLEEAAIAADAGQNVSLGNSTMAAAAGIMAGVEEDMEEDDQKMPAIPSNDGGNDHNNDNNNHTDVSNFNGTEEEDDRKPAAREDHKTKASLKDPPPLAATATTTTSSSVASLKDPPPTNITNTKMSREGLAKFLQQGNYDLTRSHGVLGWHLYRLVEDAHQYGFTRFLHWCKDDENKDTLCIPKPQDFFRTILRNCQGHYGQFTSFQTTMNTYGFKYWKGDGGAAYYQHDFFQRGQPDDAKNNIVSRELKRREEMLLLQQQQQKQQQKQEQEDQQNEEVLPKEGGHNPDQDSTGRVERRRDINIKWEEPSKPKEPGSKRKTGETDVNLTRETVAKRSKLEHSPSRPKMHVDVNALANLLQHNDQDKSQKKKKSKSPLQRYTKEVYDDECCHCLDAGDLLCCDFCPQVQHWSCLTGRYQIEVKPSRDEDVFMCQDCMDVAIRHVAETQVVATSRRPYSRDMVISLPFQLQVEEDTYDLNVGPNFGSEIFRMLEDARLQGFEFIVAWRQDGHSFEIHHRPLFVEWLLKKTFSVGAYHTIGSRLRDHGFVRVYVIVDGIDDRGWTHPYLDIGRPYLANGICKMSQMSASAKAEYRAWKSEQDDYKKKQDADTAVQVSVSEIMAKVDAGGFQSLRRYQGAQHKDQCSICNDGGKLLLCDCCDNVNHLACLRHYFSVKNPGPEDDFLCYGCLQKSIDEDPSSPRSPTKNESEVNESSISANVNLPKDEAAEKYCLRDMKYGFGTAMYNLLEDAEDLGISHLVSWSTNGKSFVIHDKEQFLERVVRKFASKNCKWCDFASTLSHHSFYRNRDDMTKFEFVNDLVIRGKPELAAQIVSNKRQPKAGSNNGSKKIASPKRVRKTTSPEKKRKSAKTTIIPHTAKVYGASELDPMLALDRLNAKRFRLDFHDDFPQALYELLEEAAEHDERYNGTGLSEILGWQPAGNAFKVSRRDLMEDLLKKCSKASCPSGKRYEMFSETLTRFEFTRVKSGREDRWANDLFRRGDTEAIEWLQARASPKHFVDDESTELSFMDFREAMEEMEDVPFLERLHYTLSNAKQFGVDHVLSWQEGGKSLQVHDPEEFEEKILPNISNQGSYISFCSSLNRFNFTNRYTVLGRGSYQHPLFVKGKPEKVVQIEARK